MNELAVKQVDLFGDTIVAAQDKDGNIWAGVKWFCEGLGLSDDQTKNEKKKIQKDLVLSKGVANLTLPTNGGEQAVLCLSIDFIPLWLAKISITPNMKENNSRLVEKLVKRIFNGIRFRHFCRKTRIYPREYFLPPCNEKLGTIFI